MKTFFLLSLLLFSFNCFGQKTEQEFAVYFGNDFTNDSVTIFVNGILIAKNVKLRATMIDPENLVITQTRENITVWPHYESKKTLKKISLDNSILNLNIEINNTWRSFSFNLKDGKFLYPEYEILRVGWSAVKLLTISQSKKGPVTF